MSVLNDPQIVKPKKGTKSKKEDKLQSIKDYTVTLGKTNMTTVGRITRNTSNSVNTEQETQKNTETISLGQNDPPKWDSKKSFLLDIKEVVQEVFEEVLKEKFETRFKTYEDSLTDLGTELTEFKTDQAEKNSSTQEKLQTVTKQLEEQTQLNKELKDKIAMLELNSRKNNIKFQNITERKNENCEQRVQEILMQCGIYLPAISFASANRVGEYVQYRIRPILVTLHHAKDKNLIMKNKQVIKQFSNVSVWDDFPPSVEKNRKILIRILQETKEHHKAKLVEDTLIINGKKYTVKNLDSLPNELKPINISTKTKNNITAFYTSFSPFSNHYACKFTYNSQTFNCSEQALMYSKAILFKDTDAAKKILDSSDPVEQKNLGKEILNFDKKVWHERSEDILEGITRAKYTQNEHLKQLLLETGDTIIVEANPYDKFWACGLGLKDNKLWEKKWEGKNIFGNILTAMRNFLKD